MEDRKIGLLITVCNEIEELEKLWEWIQVWQTNPFSRICFLVDFKNTNGDIVNLLDIIGSVYNTNCEIEVCYYKRPTTIIDSKINFADFKNFGINNMSKYCDYIFQLDVDETFTEVMLEDLPSIVNDNDVDLYLLPRENFVNGITYTDIARWQWQMDQYGRINYPDSQGRIFKSHLRFQGEVHERIVGYKTFATLPEEYALIHIKDIERQRKQNEKYSQYES